MMNMHLSCSQIKEGCHHKDTETQRSGGAAKMNTQYQAARPLCLCVFVVTFRLNVAPNFQKTVYGKANTTNDSLLAPRAPPDAATTATYCFPFFPRYVMGIAVML
jgi:hypothetical protein